MDKYWQQEVLDFVPQWEKAIKIAEAMKKNNPNDGHDKKNNNQCCNCVCDEDKELDQSVFDKWHRFQRYQRRLDAAGHRFVDVKALEDQFADEEEEERRKKDEKHEIAEDEEDEGPSNAAHFDSIAI